MKVGPLRIISRPYEIGYDVQQQQLTGSWSHEAWCFTKWGAKRTVRRLQKQRELSDKVVWEEKDAQQ